MKRRLRHLPLHAVLSAFGGDHAFAQQHLRAPDCALFDEVVVLHDQNFADVIGMIQEDDVIPSDLVVSDVAVFVGAGAEKARSDLQDGTCGRRTRADFAETQAESDILRSC